jgi:predicted glycoside hydrolase/deacetylase ChbG (UPF0249 family)
MKPLRRIWLVADDYGMSPGVSAGIRDLVLRGRLNATSVMVGTPTFERSEAISLSMLNAGATRVAIGLHVTLTAPFRPMSEGYAPLRNGAFLPIEDSGGAAMLRRLDPEAIARETATQMQAFVAAFGRVPDYVDGHQHIHLFPQVRDAVLRVVKDMAPNAWLRQCGRVSAVHTRLTDPKGLFLDWLSREFRRRARKLGIATNPGFAGTYDFAARKPFAERVPGFLRGLPQDGVFMCHPGYVDDELKRLDPVTWQREEEYAYFAGDVFPQQLQAHGLTLA